MSDKPGAQIDLSAEPGDRDDRDIDLTDDRASKITAPLDRLQEPPPPSTTANGIDLW